VGTTVNISMNAPSLGPNPSGFVLYLITNEALHNDVAAQPFGIGMAVMDMPLSKGFASPPPYTIANNIGYTSALGAPLIPGIPKAPTTVLALNNGLPPGFYTFQGMIFDDGSSMPGPPGFKLSLTNALIVKVQ
jgi:hypothetical protein